MEITLVTYSMTHRYNNDVKHIKILTKEGCFYIAENKKFRNISVSLFSLFYLFIFIPPLQFINKSSCSLNEVSKPEF